MATPPVKEGKTREDYIAAARALKPVDEGDDVLAGAFKNAGGPLGGLAAFKGPGDNTMALAGAQNSLYVRNLMTAAQSGGSAAGSFAGFMMGAGQGAALRDQQDQEAREREDDFWFWELQQNLQQLQNYIQDLNQLADQLTARIEENNRRIKEINNQINEILKTHESVKNELRHFKETGEFERNADGNIKNKDIQKVCEAYFKRTGQMPKSAGAIAVAAEDQIQYDEENTLLFLTEEKRRLGIDNELTQQDLDKIKAEENKTQHKMDELNTIKNKYGSNIDSSNTQPKQEEVRGSLENVSQDILNEVRKHYKDDDVIQGVRVEEQEKAAQEISQLNDNDGLAAFKLRASEKGLSGGFNIRAQGEEVAAPNMNLAQVDQSKAAPVMPKV